MPLRSHKDGNVTALVLNTFKVRAAIGFLCALTALPALLAIARRAARYCKFVERRGNAVGAQGKCDSCITIDILTS